ncbi:MAG: MFS transporter [Pseudomonadota bacterium]
MRWLNVAPLTGGTFLGMYPMMTTPILIGGVMDGAAMTSEQAGWIGTISVGAVAAASMLLPGLLHRFPGRAPLYLFAAILVAGYAGFAIASDFNSFAAFAFLSGIGSGGLLAGMAMRIAGMPSPDRVYGGIYAAATIAFALLLLLVPIIGGAAGVGAAFLTLAAVALVVTPALLFVSDHVVADAPVSTDGGLPWGMVMIVMLVMVITFPLYGGVYSFCERRAVAVGLSPAGVGSALGATTLMTVIGAALVAWIGTRPGRTIPTLATMAIATIAYGLALGARVVEPFVLGMLAFGLIQMALNSYFFGLASVLDPGGRVAAFLQGFSLIPYALGAALFGTLGNLPEVAIPAMAVNILGALILLPVLLKLDRAAKRARA